MYLNGISRSTTTGLQWYVARGHIYSSSDPDALQWKEAEKKKGQKKAVDTTNLLNPTRDPALGPFIMDKLYRHADKGKWGTEWGKRLKEEIDRKFLQASHVVDEDLTAPWLEFFEKQETKKLQDERRRAEIALLATHTLRAADLSAADKEVATRLLEEAQHIPENDCDRIQKHVEAVYVRHKSQIDGKC
jgi:hypothetical protein